MELLEAAILVGILITSLVVLVVLVVKHIFKRKDGADLVK
jgi:ABC-type Co2+ transport system permease subunit